MQEDQVFLFSMISMWLVISLMKHGQHLVNNKLWWQDSCSLFWFEFILLYKFPCSKNSVYDQISTAANFPFPSNVADFLCKVAFWLY